MNGDYGASKSRLNYSKITSRMPKENRICLSITQTWNTFLKSTLRKMMMIRFLTLKTISLLFQNMYLVIMEPQKMKFRGIRKDQKISLSITITLGTHSLKNKYLRMIKLSNK